MVKLSSFIVEAWIDNDSARPELNRYDRLSIRIDRPDDAPGLRRTWFILMRHEVESLISGTVDGVYWDVGSNDDHGEGCDPLDGYPVQEVAERSEWRKGVVCVLPSGDVLCPETGAILRADFCR